MGLQSFVFYVIISWLPEMLQDFGFTMVTAGWLLSYIQFISLPGTYLVPILAEKLSNQQGIIMVIGVLCIGCFTVFLIGGSLPFILFGIVSGAMISLSLAFLGMRFRNARQTAELSGMAQSVGYVMAATGPLFIGFLYDVFGTWTVSLYVMIGICLLMIIQI